MDHQQSSEAIKLTFPDHSQVDLSSPMSRRDQGKPNPFADYPQPHNYASPFPDIDPDSTMVYPPKPHGQPYASSASASQSTLPLVSEPSAMQDRYAGGPKRYDPERAQPPGISGTPYPSEKPPNGRTSSWDLLAGIKRFENSYEEFDARNASEAHLMYADGDIPKNKFSRLYNYLLNVSIVTRWILFIFPMLVLLWIPGILSLTLYPNAAIWSVRLLWWSVWLSVCWAGWWVALAASFLLPIIVKSTIGLVAVGSRRYIDWMEALHRYMALFAWVLTNWITWNPVVAVQQHNPSTRAAEIIDLIGKLLFSLFLCSAVLLFEKFAIQWIAGKFHERSYAERIADQKFAVKSLVTLYRNSSDIPGRSESVINGTHVKGLSYNPKRFFKKIKQGVRMAATTTTTAFGNVASEIAGSSVLQPNSPQAMVKTALESANKSRLLAHRIFYSFAKPGADFLYVNDILKYFPNGEEADAVFALFDKDSNGDASREEVELACLDVHREQLSIEHSMRDLDSAVGRLDNILMSVYVIIAILIIAVALEAQLATLVAGAGTLILGLSWLIGGSLQEVLTSIIFLFVKHPFDVGDRVVLSKDSYTVKEIRLLSTIFIDSNGTLVQAPNTSLNDMFIQNIRRSPQMSETFTFDVSYNTTFEDLEKLREKMLEFLKVERRDYQPAFDVVVVDFPEQEKMKLTADIKYKSNSQQSGLKAKRRNKWICALKVALAEVKIYGPKGNPDAPPSTTRYTQVPWETVLADDRKNTRNDVQSLKPVAGWQLTDKDTVVYDGADELFEESDAPNSRRRHSFGQNENISNMTMPATAMPTSAGSGSILTARTRNQ